MKLDFFQWDGDQAIFRKAVDIPEDMRPSLHDDAIKEVAAIDRYVSATDPGRQGEYEQDAYLLARALAKQGYMIRGVAHPPVDHERPGSGAVLSTDINNDLQAGSYLTGRPVANVEFIASGGVEKLIVSAVQPTDDKSCQWCFCGLMELQSNKLFPWPLYADYLLIRSPADVFYASGDGGDRNQGRIYVTTRSHYTEEEFHATGVTAFAPCADDPAARTGDSTEQVLGSNREIDTVALKPWQIAANKWTDEIDWVILCASTVCDFDGKACGWESNIANRGTWNGRYNIDLRPGKKWADVIIGTLKGHGILGFAGNGWAGERSVEQFLRLMQEQGRSAGHAWVDTHKGELGFLGVGRHRFSHRPPTAIVSSQYGDETLFDLDDSPTGGNRSPDQKGLEVWLTFGREGKRDLYGRIYCDWQREEWPPDDATNSDYVYYWTGEYSLDQNPPTFPDSYESDVDNFLRARDAPPALSKENSFRTRASNGQLSPDRIRFWRCWRDFWGSETRDPVAPTYAYRSLGSLGKAGDVSIVWPAATDPDRREHPQLSDYVEFYDYQVFPVRGPIDIYQKPMGWAKYYKVDTGQVAGRGSVNAPEVLLAALDAAKPPPEKLVLERLYAVRVRAVDNRGLKSNWSPFWVFKR
ncbi:MAG: hypothetical protein FJ291_17915 [Planctomycetes bacterium]|nr:hypothetical protein [Planctomycetota bacterium]